MLSHEQMAEALKDSGLPTESATGEPEPSSAPTGGGGVTEQQYPETQSPSTPATGEPEPSEDPEDKGHGKPDVPGPKACLPPPPFLGAFVCTP